MPRIILASRSPRRREILANLGVACTVMDSQTREHTDATAPQQMVQDLALQKARAVAQQLAGDPTFDPEDTLIIGADTVVVHGGAVLGKPKDPEQAVAMLRGLQNDTHRVFTGVALLWGARTLQACEETMVHFAPVSDREIEAYVATGEAMDKAGAYGIQGRAALWIDRIEGDYFNVMGFPVHRFYCMVKDLGWPLALNGVPFLV